MRLSAAFRASLLVICLFSATACGNMNYSTDRNDFVSDSTSNKGNRTLGNVYVNFSDEEFAQPYAVEFNRIRENSNKGYALQAPLATGENSRLHYTVSRTKDYKWFSGLQMKWSF